MPEKDWQIKKNRIDMDYQQVLQKYQVIYSAMYAIPLTILGGMFFSTGFNMNSFFFGAFVGTMIYMILENLKYATENELKTLKKKVAILG